MVWFGMEKLTCKKCGKEIEGFNENHVGFLMSQHQLKHEREMINKKKEEKK